VRPPAGGKSARSHGAIKTPVPPKPAPRAKGADGKSIAPVKALAVKGLPAKASPAKGAPAVGPRSVPPPRSITLEPAPKGDKQELKAQLGRLSGATSQIVGLKRNLSKGFYEIGGILNQIRTDRLFEVKGYGSFESFLERELDINKVVSLRMARIAEVLRREDAIAAGFERASAAVAALDGEAELPQSNRPFGSPASALPLHKQ
jgi:hypothetical protein